MKKILLSLMLIIAAPIYSKPVIINNASDYYVLDRFFKSMIQEEAFGYVLTGVKPLSALNIYSSQGLFRPDSRFFHWNVIALEAIESWNRLAPEQKNYTLKITKNFNHNYGGFYYELLFINRERVHKTIEDNIDLFRYVIGPTNDTHSLVAFIADSSKSLDSVIKSNNTLMGILLGYGTYNSLMGGRLEEITRAHGSVTPLPFCAEPISQDGILDDRSLRSYFLSRSESAISDVTKKCWIEPGLGCSTLQEERIKIDALMERVPISLLNEQPSFVFGAYRDANNKELFDQVEKSQGQIQELLSREDLLEYILEKITGERPIINCSLGLEHIEIPKTKIAEEAVAAAIWNKAQDLDQEVIPVFIEAFCRCDPIDHKKPKHRIRSGTLSGLKQARENLSKVEAQFLTVSQGKECTEVIPGYLFVKCLKGGQGKKLESESDILLSYVIEDGYGQVLAAQHKCWVDPVRLIPGFAQGLRSMREGEERLIYIHPALGYGAQNTLPPCTALIAKVTLHKIDEYARGKWPSLSPSLDLAWIKDSQFFEEVVEATNQDARYIGHLWGIWLNNSKELNFAELCKCLKRKNDAEPLAQQDLLISNRIFWNLIVQRVASR